MLLEPEYTGSITSSWHPLCLEMNFLVVSTIRISLIKPSQVMFMVKFSPAALSFVYDFVLLVLFLGHPVCHHKPNQSTCLLQNSKRSLRLECLHHTQRPFLPLKQLVGLLSTYTFNHIFFPENIVVLFFIFEYCIRFIFSPRKFRFFKQVVANADFCHFCSTSSQQMIIFNAATESCRLLCHCAIFPWPGHCRNAGDLISTLTNLTFLKISKDIEIMGKAGKIVRLVRVMRVLRIFKLVRYFTALQSLMFTLNQVQDCAGGDA